MNMFLLNMKYLDETLNSIEKFYIVKINHTCILDTVYNKTTQVSVLNESVECCGTSPFNSTVSLCCNGRLYEYKNRSITLNIS